MGVSTAIRTDGAPTSAETIAAQLNIPESCLVFGNGSCELLILLAEAFLGPIATWCSLCLRS